MRRYSKEEIRAAIEAVAEHGSVTSAIRKLGYPSRPVLYRWIQGDDAISKRTKGKIFSHYLPGIREEAVRLVEQCGLSNSEVATRLGISSPTVVYHWVKSARRGEKLMCDTPTPVIGDGLSSDGFLGDEAERIRQLELENDVLRGVVDLLKVGSLEKLTNAEKTLIVNNWRLKTGHPLREIIAFLKISKSSYEYQRSAMRRPDKYADLRKLINESFIAHDARWGSERIWAELRSGKGEHEPIFISEKVIRRIMKEDGLSVIYHKKKRSYNSYAGEQGDRPKNLVRRMFHCDAPNELWLTDITEFGLPAGKVYLSPIIDCFDGKVISHAISTCPNAGLVNSMIDDATTLLKDTDRPILHSDGGIHYWWPGWISRCEAANITRSMSKKACSPDNSACEGFFGRLKNEFFYYKDWQGVTLEAFTEMLNSWIEYYNEGRIKKSLNWKSPNQHRRNLGFVA